MLLFFLPPPRPIFIGRVGEVGPVGLVGLAGQRFLPAFPCSSLLPPPSQYKLGQIRMRSGNNGRSD
ncbi:MAG TPA: hypothetical protein ENH12_05055, partial [Proteobacteria bacterium]|nr:hypothetical protein [Pseudomonadota bacterium]